MKIEKLNLDGKKDTIEVLDSVFSTKIYKKLVHNVLYYGLSRSNFCSTYFVEDICARANNGRVV